MIDFEARRLFSHIISREILLDFAGRSIDSILDFGCGDGYTLNLLKSRHNCVNALCVEKDLTLVRFDSLYKITYEEFVDSYSNLTNLFDVILVIDVIHLLSVDDILKIFSIFYNTLKNNGIIYVMLGIYTESRGVHVFKEIMQNLKASYGFIEFHSIKDIIKIFLSLGFEVFLKRIDIRNIFGLKIEEKLVENIIDYLDYLYNDKLLIKLTKERV